MKNNARVEIVNTNGSLEAVDSVIETLWENFNKQ